MSARAGRWIAAVGCGALLVCSSAGGAEAGRPHPFWFDLLPPVGDSALVRPEIDPEALPPGCEFPQTITIRGDNLLLVRVGNDTIPFFDRGVEIDYRDGELIIDGIHTRPQPTRLTDATLERMYSKVPFLQEQVAAGSTWGEAADVYFDSTSAIWSSVQETYFQRLAHGVPRITAAREIAKELREHPFVDRESLKVIKPKDSKYGDPHLELTWKGRRPEDYWLLHERLDIKPNYLYPRVACDLVASFRLSLGDETPTVVFWSGVGSKRWGRRDAPRIIEAWRTRQKQ